MHDDSEVEVTEPSSPSDAASPLRMGGFVMLGIAAVAAVVGLVSLAGGDTAAAPVPANAAPAPAPPAAPAPAPGLPAAGEPAPAGQPPAPAPAQPPVAAPPGPPEPTGLAAPPAEAPRNGGGPAPQEQPLPGAGLPADNGSGSGSTGKGATAKAPVRVYNNSLIKDLAQQAADDFRGSGWQVTEVGNYSEGNIPTSTVYYRQGTSEQSAAEALASSFGMRAVPRFAGLADASPGLIVVVTKDFQRR